MPRSLRILVVDDSLLYRMAIRKALIALDNVEVVGSAADGAEALELLAKYDPDLLTLDVQMPGIDGIGVLRGMQARGARAKAIMVSSLTATGAKATAESLLNGAFDFILKPKNPDADKNLAELRTALGEKIDAVRECQFDQFEDATPAPPSDLGTLAPDDFNCRLIVIGTSTGGPAALRELLPLLPASLGAPVVVVQHMPVGYTTALAARLDGSCPLTVREAGDNVPVRAGEVLIAPGGTHLRLRGGESRLYSQLVDDPPEHGCRPSVDYLLRSAAPRVGTHTLAVVLTGMGRDGTEGCRLVKERGGRVIAQDAASSTVYGMPGSVIGAGLADVVAPLGQIGRVIGSIVRS